MLCLMLGSRQRLRSVPRLARDRSYVMLVVVYTLLFCVAFSSLGNFGILTRQRVQLLPIALVLLALPSRPVPAGRALTAEDIAIKRPGYGIPVYDYDAALGRVAAVEIEPDEILQRDMLR